MYLLRGVSENGDPVDVPVEVCWRCFALVALNIGSIEEHNDRQHPPRHRLREGEVEVDLPPVMPPPPPPERPARGPAWREPGRPSWVRPPEHPRT